MADKLLNPNSDSGSTNLNQNLPSSVNKKMIDASIEQRRIEEEGKKGERGILGRFWGSIEHSSNNIAGLFIVLLLIIGSGYTICMLKSDSCDNHSKVLEFWGMLSPMLTLALGYLFGRGQSNQ